MCCEDYIFGLEGERGDFGEGREENEGVQGTRGDCRGLQETISD